MELLLPLWSLPATFESCREPVEDVPLDHFILSKLAEVLRLL